MKLNELNTKPSMVAKKALKENFNVKTNFNSLNLAETKRMLSKVKGLISEMKASNSAHSREQNPAYLKAVFMEQALTHHYGELRTMPMYNPRIVVENEEVEKSQVILAAQEMVDSVQKMIEDVSDMLVKELPAVIDGVNNEVGTSEGQQFNQQATDALTQLQAALTAARTGLQGALGTVTGQGGGMEMGAAPEAEMGDEMGVDMGAEMGDEMSDVSVEEPEADMGDEMPPEEAPAVGRSIR